jgi:hypothetical protein
VMPEGPVMMKVLAWYEPAALTVGEVVSPPQAVNAASARIPAPIFIKESCIDLS